MGTYNGAKGKKVAGRRNGLFRGRVKSWGDG